MVRTRIARALLMALTFFVLLPAASLAQSGTIAGVVRDTTGAVMPGVTVEAASPALIEKVRTAVTDGEGQYKIVDLVPGAYTVTFTLTGFSTVRREGIDLSAGFTASVNADLRVGTLAETITVSGQAPTVDVQNTREQSVMTRDVIDAVPTGRSPQDFAVLVPGVTAASSSALSAQDVGGTVNDRTPVLIVHGSRGSEMPLLYDGMRYNNMNATPGGGHLIWAVNNGAVQEFSVEVGALAADSDVSGVRENAIPKMGGNTLHGSFFATGTNDSLQASNTIASQATTYPRIYDINPAVGGPIVQDKLWYFTSYRAWGLHEHPAGGYFNLNGPLALKYTPNLGQPAVNEVSDQSESLRFTWQATSKNKFSLWADDHQRCWCHWGLASNVTPDASGVLKTYPNLLTQLTWNAPLTNKVLIDAGYTLHPESWGRWPQPYIDLATTYPILEQSTNTQIRAATGTLAGAVTGNGPYIQHRSLQENFKLNVSYVTGSHAFKIGVQDMWGWRNIQNWAAGDGVTLNLLNGVPQSLNEYTFPYNTVANVPYYLGAFVQDQWTVTRLTLNLGLRYDAMNSYIPAQTYQSNYFTGPRSFGAVNDAPNWRDIDPRLGAAYDVFGNGKTALKVNVGRYVQGVTTGWADTVNPVAASVNAVTRTWNDTSGTFDPRQDCNLNNPAANGGCGAISNVNFGKGVLLTALDPGFANGWFKRPYDWETQVGVQHEISRGLSLNATWTRHSWGNFVVLKNLDVTPSNFDPFCITAPADPRLPGGGGNQICGIYDVNPSKFGQVNNLLTLASNYGNESDVYKGIDVSVNARLPRGILVQGGFNTGHEVEDNCGVAGLVNNNAITPPTDIARAGVGTPLFTNLSGMNSPSTLYCHIAPPLQTQVKLLGSLPLPWNMTASAAFQSLPGPQITATDVVPSAQIAPSLGRSLAAGPNATASVELIAPGALYGDRLNQLDFRFSKTVTFGGARRLKAMLDFYNLLNADPVLQLNTRYGPAWETPTAVLPGRMFKIGGLLEF